MKITYLSNCFIFCEIHIPLYDYSLIKIAEETHMRCLSKSPHDHEGEFFRHESVGEEDEAADGVPHQHRVLSPEPVTVQSGHEGADEQAEKTHRRQKCVEPIPQQILPP